MYKKISNILICTVFAITGSANAEIFVEKTNSVLDIAMNSYNASQKDAPGPDMQICWSPRIERGEETVGRPCPPRLRQKR